VFNLATKESQHETTHHLQAIRDAIVEGPVAHAGVPLQPVYIDRHFLVDAQEGEIGAREHAAATSCHRVLKIARDGKVESILTSERPLSPTGVAVHGGAVYVLEYTNANGGPDEGWLPRVRRLGRDGTVATFATIAR
jgi:hypothetical protein